MVLLLLPLLPASSPGHQGAAAPVVMCNPTHTASYMGRCPRHLLTVLAVTSAMRRSRWPGATEATDAAAAAAAATAAACDAVRPSGAAAPAGRAPAVLAAISAGGTPQGIGSGYVGVEALPDQKVTGRGVCARACAACAPVRMGAQPHTPSQHPGVGTERPRHRMMQCRWLTD